MIKQGILAGFAAGALLAAIAPQSRAEAEVSVSVFRTALEPHGEWIEVGDYGPCWRPTRVRDDWRPYTEGRWAYTDDGWCWVSDEPFGWAVYHYGRWVDVEDTGWCWVPDTEWAPAWVSWRHGHDHIGWAPLPPEARFRAGVNISFGGWVDSYFDIGPRYYTFVPVRGFGSPRIRDVIVHHDKILNIYAETVNITNIRMREDRIFVGGPEYDRIVDVSESRIPRLRLEREFDFQGDRGERIRSRIEGDRLMMPAPRVRGDFRQVAGNISRRVERPEFNRGWRGLPEERATELRRRMERDAAPPDEVARELIPTHGLQPGMDRDRGPQGEDRMGRDTLPNDRTRDRDRDRGDAPGATLGRDADRRSGMEGRPETREDRDNRGSSETRESRSQDAPMDRPRDSGTDAKAAREGDRDRADPKAPGSAAGSRDREAGPATEDMRSRQERGGSSAAPSGTGSRDRKPDAESKTRAEGDLPGGGRGEGTSKDKDKDKPDPKSGSTRKSEGASQTPRAKPIEGSDTPKPTREVSGQRGQGESKQQESEGSSRKSGATAKDRSGADAPSSRSQRSGGGSTKPDASGSESGSKAGKSSANPASRSSGSEGSRNKSGSLGNRAESGKSMARSGSGGSASASGSRSSEARSKESSGKSGSSRADIPRPTREVSGERSSKSSGGSEGSGRSGASGRSSSSNSGGSESGSRSGGGGGKSGGQQGGRER